jgi:hypothetical protein
VALAFSSMLAAKMVVNVGSVIMVPTVVRMRNGKFVVMALEMAVMVLSVV